MAYYVYGVMVDGQLRYIGMGKGNRVNCLAPNNERVREALWEGCDVYGVVFVNGLTRTEALKREDACLLLCGRTLWNKRVTTTSEFVRVRNSDVNFARRHRRTMRQAFTENEKMRRGLEAGRTSEVHLRLWQDPTYRTKISVAQSAALQRRITADPVAFSKKMRYAAQVRWAKKNEAA